MTTVKPSNPGPLKHARLQTGSMPLLFAIGTAGGLIGGLWALIYAASGIGRTGILASVTDLPEGRLLAGISGVTMLATAITIVLHHRRGLVVWIVFVTLNYIVSVPYIAWRYWHIPSIDETIFSLALAVILIVYGWVNRDWFRRPG